MGAIHSPSILCLRIMAANTLRRAVPSRQAFWSKASAACGSHCGKFRSCAPRSAETMLVDSKKRIRRSQDNSVFEAIALAKSTESRLPSSGRRDSVEVIERASRKVQEQEHHIP